VLCRFVLLSSVEAFDADAFRRHLLELAPSAIRVVDLSVSSGSISVRATLVYSNSAAAQADENRLQKLEASELTAALGETAESFSVSLLDVASPSPPPAPPVFPTEHEADVLPTECSTLNDCSPWWLMPAILASSLTVCSVIALTTVIVVIRRLRRRRAGASETAKQAPSLPASPPASSRTPSARKIGRPSFPGLKKSYSSLDDRDSPEVRPPAPQRHESAPSTLPSARPSMVEMEHAGLQERVERNALPTCADVKRLHDAHAAAAGPGHHHVLYHDVI